MGKIEKYTVLSIINKYKDLIWKDMEDIIRIIFFENNEEGEQFINNLEEQLPKTGKSNIIRGDKTLRAGLVYTRVINALKEDEESNNDLNVKLAFLSEIYRRFCKSMSQKEKQTLKGLILGDKEFAIYKHAHETYDGIDDYDIITREKKAGIKSIADKKLRTILETAFKQVFAINDIKSIIKSMYSEQLYPIIMQKLLTKFLLEGNRISLKEYKETRKEDFDRIIFENAELKHEFEKMIIEYFEENFQYIDKEKLLLNSVARIILGMKITAGEEIEGIELNYRDHNSKDNQIMKSSIGFIREVNEELKNSKYGYIRYTILVENSKEAISITREDVAAFLNRCTDNEYVSNREEEEIHTNLLKGILVDDLQKRRIAKIDINDVYKMMEAYEGKEKNDDIRNKILNTAIEVVEYLKSTENITDEELVSLYLKGNINFDLISRIDMSKIPEQYFHNMIKDLYIEMIYSNDNTKKTETEKLERFSRLYNKLGQEGKININADELVSNMAEIFGQDFIEEIVADLHYIEVINIEQAVSWTGTGIFFEKYNKGNFKPTELKEFYEKGLISLEQIITMINRIPINKEKFMVIGSIFPGDEEEEVITRQMLTEECIKVEQGETSKSKGKRRKIVDPVSNGYKNIIDPFARLSLIQGLDKDYSFEMTDDGHAIVKLPNLKKVVIEKMLDKNSLPSYGAATYILDEEYYDSNYSSIIVNGKISRSNLVERIATKKVDKIVHGIESWGKNIKEYFGIEENSKWSKEEIEEIDKAIQRIKRTSKIKE